MESGERLVFVGLVVVGEEFWLLVAPFSKPPICLLSFLLFFWFPLLQSVLVVSRLRALMGYANTCIYTKLMILCQMQFCLFPIHNYS